MSVHEYLKADSIPWLIWKRRIFLSISKSNRKDGFDLLNNRQYRRTCPHRPNSENKHTISNLKKNIRRITVYILLCWWRLVFYLQRLELRSWLECVPLLVNFSIQEEFHQSHMITCAAIFCLQLNWNRWLWSSTFCSEVPSKLKLVSEKKGRVFSLKSFNRLNI